MVNNSCIANSSYINITVLLTKLVYTTLKCFILSTTPFDFIIGRNTIKKHHLVFVPVLDDVLDEWFAIIGWKMEEWKNVIYPTPGYSATQNFEWETQIPILELLMHCKTKVTHGKQSNDAIIQTALKQIRFDINLSDVSSVDKITLYIRNTLIRDLPPRVRVNPQLQQVMLKSLMNTLSKSEPSAFCKDIHIYIQSRPKTEVHGVDKFNTAFNTEACRFIKSIENTAKCTNSSVPTNPVEILVPLKT